MTTEGRPTSASGDGAPAVPTAASAPRDAPAPSTGSSLRGAAAGGAPRARARKPAPGWVFGGALGTFFAALALLAVQVRAGDDPALGEPTPVAEVDERPRRVIVKRRVIKRIVVHHPRPAADAAARSSSAAPTASAPAATSAPSAPAPVAAPAPAPAPAPASAPLTTQSS